MSNGLTNGDRPPLNDSAEPEGVDFDDSTSAENIRAFRRVLDSPNIAKLVDAVEKHLNEVRMDRREAVRQGQRFVLVGYILALILVLIVLLVFQQKPDLLMPVLTAVLGILATIGAGLGFRMAR